MSVTALEIPASDINDLDDVVRELGIEDSHTTPAEAVRELKVEVERLRSAKRRALAIADERSRENVELRAEIERLRLEKRRAPAPTSPQTPPGAT